MSTTHTALEETNAPDLSRAQIQPLELDGAPPDASELLLARATMPPPALQELQATDSETAPQTEVSAARYSPLPSVRAARPSLLRRLGDTLKEPHASISGDDSNFTAAHVSGRALLDNATHIVGAPLSFVGCLGAGIANLSRSFTSALVRTRPQIDSYRAETNARHFLKKAGANFTESLRDVGDLLNHTQALIPNAVRTLFFGLGAACDGGVNVLAAISV